MPEKPTYEELEQRIMELEKEAVGCKQAEETLKASQEYTRNVIDSSLDMIITVDIDRYIVEFNKAAEETFGYRREEVVGIQVDILYADPQEGLAVHKKTVEQDQCVQEILNRRKNGEVFPSFLSASLLRNPHGEMVGVMGVSRDITEQKQTDETLRESEAQKKAILDASIDRIRLVDKDMRIIWANKTTTRELNIAPEDLVGQYCYKIFVGRDAPCVECPTKKAFNSGNIESAISHQPFLKGIKGETYWDGYAIPIKNESGDIVNFIQISRNITERKLAEDKIKASLKEKEVLLKEVHHRVKNNLQVISSLLNLQSGYVKDREALEMFKESQYRVRSMALIHEKLYQSEDMARIDIAAYIQDLTAFLFSAYTVSKAIKVTIAVTDIFLDITTAIPCGLIINELVSNALKHAFPQQREGTITVSMTLSNKDSLILTVSDTGIGFPEGIDFRNTTTLGMQLVTSLVEQLEGTITLDRSEGTTFTITFRGGGYSIREGT